MRRLIIAIAISLVLILALILYLKILVKNESRFWVKFFNVGQGDAALNSFCNGQKCW